MNPPSVRGPFPRLVPLAGILSAALGVTVLISWYAHIAVLIQLRPDLAPMQYNTALCFVLAGAAFQAFAHGRHRIAQVLGGALAVLSILTLFEYLSGLSLGIDQLLFHPYITTQTSVPGRMSPVTAFCFLLIGIAVILTRSRVPEKLRLVALGSVGSVVMAICFVAVLGYAVGLPGTYGWHQLTRIALHTAGGLAVLGAGVFAMAWNAGTKEGERTPRWISIPLGLGMLTASFILSQALQTKHNQEIAETMKARAQEVKAVLNVSMEARILSMARMARRWDFAERQSQDAWENDAESHVKDFPDFQAVEWIDPAFLVRWIVPLEGNEDKLNRNLTTETERHRAVQTAIQSRGPAVTQTVRLVGGGLGCIVYVPVYSAGKFDGLLAAVLKTDLLFNALLPAPVAAGNSIVIYEGGRRIYEREPGPMPPEKNWTADVAVDIRGIHWFARVFPTPKTVARIDSNLPVFVLAAGILLSAMLALTAYLTQTVSTRAREAASVNAELRAALAEVKTLSGLLPICYDCKRIRDDGGYWNRLEKYISQRSDASFSHGLCPECAIKAFKEAGIAIPESLNEALALQGRD